MGQGVNSLLQTRLERATHGLGNRCSILLSYWSINQDTPYFSLIYDDKKFPAIVKPAFVK